MSNNPYQSPDTDDGSVVKKPGGLPGKLITWLVVAGVIGLLIALCLPAVRFSRPAARRMQCYNHLKQIAFALQYYEEEYGSLPPAYTVDEEGKPLHSWRTLILPYMEQQALYDTIDLSKPWDDPANRVACEATIYTYQCPSADCPPSHTTYLAVVAPGGCFQQTEPRLLSEITDDPEMTLMVVDVTPEHHVHWMSPTDVDQQWILGLGTHTTGPHPGGVQAACAAGNVIFLSSDTEAAAIRALISIDGNDDPVAQGAF